MDCPLNTAELDELKKRLKGMSVTALQDFYRAAYWQCRLEKDVPPAQAIQRLVTAWKQLRVGWR